MSPLNQIKDSFHLLSPNTTKQDNLTLTSPLSSPPPSRIKLSLKLLMEITMTNKMSIMWHPMVKRNLTFVIKKKGQEATNTIKYFYQMHLVS